MADAGHVDSTRWKKAVSSQKGGETHPAPKEAYVQRVGGREVTPDPYVGDNPAVRRNFGYR